MSALERLEVLENNFNQLRGMVESLDLNANPMLQMVAEKSVGIEQSMVAISKTLAAITEELIETGVLKSEGVMDRMRDAQDGEQVNQVKSLKEANMLDPAEEISERSIVIVKHSLINTQTGEIKILSNYRLVSMSHPTTNQVIRSNLIGKKIKETVEGTVSADQKDIITIKEIYNLKEAEVQGELPMEDNEVSFDDQTETQTQE